PVADAADPAPFLQHAAPGGPPHARSGIRRAEQPAQRLRGQSQEVRPRPEGAELLDLRAGEAKARGAATETRPVRRGEAERRRAAGNRRSGTRSGYRQSLGSFLVSRETATPATGNAIATESEGIATECEGRSASRVAGRNRQAARRTSKSQPTRIIMHASLAAGAFAGLVCFASSLAAADADLIVHHAKVVTVDAKFSVAEALAVKDGKIAAIGTVAEVMKLKGPGTKLLDAGGKTVLPGLYDSHSHPVGAASAAAAKKPLPDLHSIAEVQEYIKKKAAEAPAGQWIVLQYVFPTRLKEARFPTKEELDAAAPKHPVLYHAGPAGITNSMGLKVSGITKETKSPKAGMVVKDPTTGEPTG